jgi:hypothetical protein
MTSPPILARVLACWALLLLASGCGDDTVRVSGGTDESAAPVAAKGKAKARMEAARKIEESPEIKKHGKLR